MRRLLDFIIQDIRVRRATPIRSSEQMYRVVKNLPLADTDAVTFSGMLNLVGAEGFSGKVVYAGLDEVLKLPKHIFTYMVKQKLNRAEKWDILMYWLIPVKN